MVQETRRQFEVRGPMWHMLLLPYLEGRYKDIPIEQCWWGPAGTAKTMTTLIVLDTILRDVRFEGVRVLWMRKTLQSCKQSSLVTFEDQVLAPGDPMLRGRGRQTRDCYLYKRPGRINNELVIAGMNNATRWYGSEFDIVVLEETIEFQEADIETLWRAMRPRDPSRGLGLPFKTVIMLTNPDSQFHWLYKRMRGGRTRSFFVGIECNPSYFDLQRGMPTEAGQKFLDNMESQMQGERYMRLRRGRWVSAEGVILKTFGPIHLTSGEIKREPYQWPKLVMPKPHPIFGASIELRWFFASMDFGDRAPGTVQVWGVTKEGMLVRVAEIYHADRDIKWWAEWCCELYGEFSLRAIVCDSSRPKEIDYINDLIAEEYKLQKVEEYDKHGEVRRVSPRIAIPCQKNTSAASDLTNVVLLRYAFGLDNEKPRILLVRDVERVVDTALRRDNQPMGLIEEIPGWTWAKHDPHKHASAPREVPDELRPNHAIDATAYAIAYAWGRDLSRDPSKDAPKHPVGSYGHHRQFVPWKQTKLAKKAQNQ
jgi:hypothetical protein